MSKKKSPQGQTFHLNYCEIYYGKHYSFSRIFPKTVKSTHQIHLHEFFHNFSQETLSNFLYKQVSKNLQLERQKKMRILSSFKAFFDFTKVFNHRLCPLKNVFYETTDVIIVLTKRVFTTFFVTNRSNYTKIPRICRRNSTHFGLTDDSHVKNSPIFSWSVIFSNWPSTS